MDENSLAQVGFNRLRHPVSMAKLMAVHAGAAAMQSAECGVVVWREYLNWLSGLVLESEVAEALLLAFLARRAPNFNAGELRRAVSRYSILSDYMLACCANSKILVNSWANCHSGEIPDLYRPSAEAVGVTDGTKVPPIFAIEFDRLERQSGHPFRRQWEFEIERLIARYGHPHDGSVNYWTAGERDAVDRYVGRASHYARSAYLRTLALAVDVWGMPEDVARSPALIALPASLLYVQVPPGDMPGWSKALLDAAPCNDKTASELARALTANTNKQGERCKLLYLNAPLCRSDSYEAEFRIVSCYVKGAAAESEVIFRLQDLLMTDGGPATVNRGDDAVVPPIAQRPLDAPGNVQLLPALVADVRDTGYITSGIWQRCPCLPANYADREVLRAIPRPGGLDLMLNVHELGKMTYWNQQWRPWHRPQLGPPCGVALEIQAERYSVLGPGAEWRLERHWELHWISREKDWGEWEEHRLCGRCDEP